MRAAPLLVPLLLLAPFAPAVSAAEDAAGATSYYFEAPSDFRGPLAVAMTFDFGAANECVFRVVASGDTREPPVLSWEEWGGSGGAFSSSFAAQAHVPLAEGQRLDTREVKGRGTGDWSMETTRSGPFSGTLGYAHVIVDAASWIGAGTGYHAPFVLDVSCARPFAVGGFSMGFEAVGFTRDSLSGGTGVTAQQLYGSVAHVEGDGLEAAFTHGEVRFRGNARAGDGLVEGELRLSSPDGARAWTLDGSRLRMAHEGGAGAYAVQLDYRAVTTYDSVTGILFGLDPVDALAF